MKGFQSSGFERVRFEDWFWQPAIKRLAGTTLPYCLQKCEDTPRIENFRRCAAAMKNGTTGNGGHQGIYFDDSDVYKIIEGAAYVLHGVPDKKLKSEMDELIALIASCQWEDGYINTYYTLNAPNERWTDMGKHEDYCIGHLIEAGVAYFQATGERSLLEVSIRASKHMQSLFGPGKRIWVVGHQEPELALVKLWKVTKDRSHLEFAHWLLEQRGHGHSTGHSCDVPVHGITLAQDDKPLREVEKVVGHAVRAMYYFSGVADVADSLNDEEYRQTLYRVWDNVCAKNMYVTGGIGPNRRNEGFKEDYFLPIDDNYCETCAQIGMTYFNHRMNLMTGEAKYADIVELELYNGVLSGLAADGKHFFYANPMQSDGDKVRSEWFGCSCCPSNLCRFIPSVGEYWYATAPGTVIINQFGGGKATLEVDGVGVKVTQTTQYPYQGRVDIHIECIKPLTIKLRMPAWCRSASVTGAQAELRDDGYFEMKISTTAQITYEMDMPARLVKPNPNCKEIADMAVLARGPLVYCIEAADNGDVEKEFLTLCEDFNVHMLPTETFTNTLAMRVGSCGGNFTAIPYFLWGNRETGWMRTYIKLNTDSALLYPGHTRV